MVKNDQNGQKWSKSPKMVKIAKNGQNGLKWSKMVQNGPKWSKMVFTKKKQCNSTAILLLGFVKHGNDVEFDCFHQRPS